VNEGTRYVLERLRADLLSQINALESEEGSETGSTGSAGQDCKT